MTPLLSSRLASPLLFLLLLLAGYWSIANSCPVPCVNGECNNTTDSCSCKPNWYGADCNVSACEHVKPCLNGGTCRQAQGEDFICSCPPNYGGALCQSAEGPGSVTLCGINDMDPCVKDHGTCVVDYLGNTSCVCKLGYGGNNCSEKINDCLAGGGCANGGRCVQDGDYWSCTCAKGWAVNLQCREPEHNACAPIPPCKNGASCTVPVPYISGPKLFCHCTPGFTGTNCTETYCDSNPCQNGGSCTNMDTTYNCFCPLYYSGKNCQTHPCLPNKCSNGGTCTPTGTQPPYSSNCTCAPGFQGDHCEDDVDECAMDNPCSDGATCVNTYGGFYCDCPPGFEGPTCQGSVNDCASNPCLNGGTCIDGVNSYECTCPRDYEGLSCETPKADTCFNHGCYNGGTCEYDTAKKRHICECANGFMGNFCKYSFCDFHPSCPHECKNNGLCVHLNGTSFCKCEPGWGGADCSVDINECSQQPCKNGGTCMNSLGSYECSCPPSLTGPNCETNAFTSCQDSPCKNGGTCAPGNDGYVNCSCLGNFRGHLCELEKCPYPNCSNLANNGNCDYACFTAACDYDGGFDCYPQANTTDPFLYCPTKRYCRDRYSNGFCDYECNNALCLYDGADCVSPPSSCPDSMAQSCEALVNNGECNGQCNTAECPIDFKDCEQQLYLPKYLVLWAVTINGVSLRNRSEAQEFAADVGSIIHAYVEIQSIDEVTESDIFDEGFNVTNVELGLPSDTTFRYWKVVSLVNIQYCVAACPTSIRQVIATLDAAYSHGKYNTGVARIAGQSEQDRPAQPEAPDLTPVYVVAAGIVVLVILVIGGLLGKRVRDNGGISPTLKRIRVNHTWQVPGGQTPEPTTPPQTREPSLLSDRRSSSVELLPSSTNGIRKDIPHITWSRVEVPVVKGSADGSTCVIGHSGSDSRRWTKLHRVASRHTIEEIQAAVTEDGKVKASESALNVQGPGGYTPLMVAILSEKKKRLYPAVPTRSDSSSGSEQGEGDSLLGSNSHSKPRYSPLKATKQQASPSLHSPLAALITPQTDLTIANDRGETVLHVAARCSHNEYVQLLLKCKADPNQQDIWGQSALHVAIGAAADGVFKILLEHPGTNLELKSKGGITPLMLAVKMLNHRVVQALVAKGVEISTTDSDGRTAVHWASMMDNLDGLKILVSHGPDTIKDVQNTKGETALFLACREGHTNIVHHLLDCFANATLLDNLDRSPLSIAYEKQHFDVVELLQHSSQGTLCPPPSYMPKSLGVPAPNSYYHPHGVKVEGGVASMKSVLPPHAVNHLPHSHPPHHRIQTQSLVNDQPMATSSFIPTTTSSIPRVSSLEAELDKLIASTVDPTTMYPTYLPNYPSPPLSHNSPPYMGQAYSSVDATMNMAGGMVHDGGPSNHSSPRLASESLPGRHMNSVSLSPQDPAAFTYATTVSTEVPYSMTSNHLTAYSCQTCPTSITTSAADQMSQHQQQQQAISASRHPHLQHVSNYTRPATSLGEPAFSSSASSSGQQYLHPAHTTSAPTTSSVDQPFTQQQHHAVAKPEYSTALGSISMHNEHRRPSPPLAQTVSPHMVQQPGGFSPPQQGTSNNSPSNFGYLSPPKEPGDYPLYNSSYANNDSLSCLTPSPEDYSNHGNERSPPGQTTVHTLGHYHECQYQPLVYEYGAQPLHNHITASSSLLGFNSRESTV